GDFELQTLDVLRKTFKPPPRIVVLGFRFKQKFSEVEGRAIRSANEFVDCSATLCRSACINFSDDCNVIRHASSCGVSARFSQRIQRESNHSSSCCKCHNTQPSFCENTRGSYSSGLGCTQTVRSIHTPFDGIATVKA